EALPQPTEFQAKEAQAPSYKEQRGRFLDPNAYRTRAPFNRVRSTRAAPKRLRAGSSDARFILPRLTLEGLRPLTIDLAHQQQNSDWPAERCRYPKISSARASRKAKAATKMWARTLLGR